MAKVRLEIKSCKSCPLLGKHPGEDGIVHVWCQHPMSAHGKLQYKIGKVTFKGFRIGVRKPAKSCPLYYYPIELEVK